MIVLDIYEQGDPQLLAFAALLNSQTPADLTRQMEARQRDRGPRDQAYDELHAAEVLLQVREDQVEDGQATRSRAQRQEAADAPGA